MNRPPSDPFLKDIFTGAELDELRQASLARGLAALRRRRHFRQAASVAGLTAVALLFATVWLSRQATQPNAAAAPRVQIAANPMPAATTRDEIASAAKTAPSGAKILSDDELLALFPHQQVALIGAPGHQQLLVFDDNGDQRSL